MKILIITMTCGEGHNSIAKALGQIFTDTLNDVKVIQLYKEKSLSYKINDKMYIWAQKHIPKLYQHFWFKLRRQNPNKRYSLSMQSPFKVAEKRIAETVSEFNPDAIICTHFYPSAVINRLIRAKKIDKNCKTYTILTDYAVHPQWECCIENDFCFVPSKDCCQDLIQKGFKENQLIEVGIPIQKKFETIYDKDENRKKLNIENKFTILIMGGGMGITPPDNILKALAKVNGDFQVIVVCGRNLKQKERSQKLVKKYNLNAQILGFVNNVDEIMDASDIIITRGGALSITEALCKELPIVFRENLYINEKLNQEVFIKNGLGYKLNKPEDIIPLIDKLLKDSQELNTIVENMKKFKKTNVSTKIAEFVLEQHVKTQH